MRQAQRLFLTRQLFLLASIFTTILACNSRADKWSVEYEYAGEYSSVFPSAATALDDNKLTVAKGKVLRLIKMPDSIPNQIEVEEEYYDSDGTVTYRGTIIMRFDIDGAVPIKENRLFGKKTWSAFPSWPDNTNSISPGFW